MLRWVGKLHNTTSATCRLLKMTQSGGNLVTQIQHMCTKAKMATLIILETKRGIIDGMQK
jgi:hypothetical protein